MVIDCPYCQSRVDCREIGQHTDSDPRELPFRITLLECPGCKNGIIAGQSELPTEDGYDWDLPARLWPKPDRVVWSLPEIVRVSLEEAMRCLRGGAYTACAVMCGRALEGLCKDQGTQDPGLFAALKELRDKQIIDARLFEWAEALRKMRNIAAHATPEKVSAEDANDLLDFVHAICDYVYLLNRKFEDFMKRQKRPKEEDFPELTAAE